MSTTVDTRRNAPGPFAADYRIASAGIVLMITLVAFETISVATAMPTAVEDLDGVAWYGWAFTGVLVASVVGMVVGGEVCDRRGVRRPLVGSVALFAAGLAVAGSAPVMAVFIVGRAMQGFSSGVLIVAIYVLIADVYPEALRPKVFGVTSAAWVVPSLVGPTVAGFLAENVHWRWVFLGLLPLFAVGVGLLVPVVRRVPHRVREQPAAVVRRWPHALAAAGGLAAIQYAVQRLDAVSVPLLALGVALLVWGLRTLLPAGTALVRRGVPAVVAFRGIAAGAFFAMESLLPLTLTVVHGYGATRAGVPLMVGALGWAAASWAQGRWPGVSRTVLLRTGFTLIAVAALLLAVVSQEGAPGWPAYAAWVVGGAGTGFVMPVVGVLLLEQTPEEGRGVASSALQISDSTMSSITIGLGGALVAAAERGSFGISTAVLTLDLLMGALAATGAVLAGRAVGRRAAPGRGN